MIKLQALCLKRAVFPVPDCIGFRDKHDRKVSK